MLFPGRGMSALIPLETKEAWMYGAQLRTFGYTEVNMLRDNTRCWQATAKASDGRKVFLKMVVGQRQDHDLRAEEAFNTLVRNDPSTPFAAPRAHMVVEGEFRILELEHLEMEWIDAIARANRMLDPFTDADLEHVYRAVRHLQQVPSERVPRVLKKRPLVWSMERADFIAQMFHWCADAEARAPTVFDWHKARALIERIRDLPFSRALAHYDLLAKNLGRSPDGRLVVVDAEFSGWHLTWDDPAILFVEMYTRDGRPPAAALRALRHIVARHRQDEPEDDLRSMLFPLAKRVLWHLNILSQGKADRASTLELFERVSTLDIDAIIAP